MMPMIGFVVSGEFFQERVGMPDKAYSNHTKPICIGNDTVSNLHML